MSINSPYWMIGFLVLACIIVGWSIRGIVDKKPDYEVLKGSMAYGFQEDEEVWNRIRVDVKGNVICSKE